jgi:hypothetical protein
MLSIQLCLLNYGVLSPARATRSQAKNAIGDNNFCDNAVDKGIDLAYDSDSDDNEDYRGDVYANDYSDGEESLGQYRVPLARGRGAGRKPKAGQPLKPDTKGMSARKKQASSTVAEVGKGKKRKADTETHAPKTKQVATDGTKRVSERQRKKK